MQVCQQLAGKLLLTYVVNAVPDMLIWIVQERYHVFAQSKSTDVMGSADLYLT